MDQFYEFLDLYAGRAWRTRDTTLFPVQERVQWSNMPLSSVTSPLLGTALYLLGVWLLEVFMSSRPAYDLKAVFLVHNIVLSIFALVTFIGVLWNVCIFFQDRNLAAVWYDPEWEMPGTDLQLWCYVFYVSKYYELLDTAFLVLRKKPVMFVQKWHHTNVLMLFWSFMEARMINHWPLVLINSFVHIFVYLYFALAILKIRIPYVLKASLTILQISQFVADMVWALPYPYFKQQEITQGDWGPWVFGQLIGVSFVLLFTQIFISNRRKAQKVKRAKAE